MSRLLIIYGYSDYAVLCREYLTGSGDFEFRGYLVDTPYLESLDTSSVPALAFDSTGAKALISDGVLFTAIGYRSMRARRSCFEKAREAGAEMTNFVAPSAYVAESAELGTNNIIMPGAVIEPFARLGNNNTVWSNATICHDTTIGDHNFFAAGSIIGGGVSVGSLCFFGFASSVLQGLEVGDESLLAAGAVLTRSVPGCQRLQGVPAEAVSEHREFGIEIN